MYCFVTWLIWAVQFSIEPMSQIHYSKREGRRELLNLAAQLFCLNILLCNCKLEHSVYLACQCWLPEFFISLDILLSGEQRNFFVWFKLNMKNGIKCGTWKGKPSECE